MEKSQLIYFVTLAIYVVAAIFFLFGLGGSNWYEYKDIYNAGLWKVCSSLVDECVTIKLKDQEDWYKTVAALMILGFVGVVASGISFLWTPITAVCHCVTGGLALIAVIIFGAKYQDAFEDIDIDFDLGWSFALAALSAILFLINGGIMAAMALSTGCNMSRRTCRGSSA